MLDPATVRIGPGVVLEPDVDPASVRVARGRDRPRGGLRDPRRSRASSTRTSPADAVVGPHCDVEGARIGPRARVGPSRASGPAPRSRRTPASATSSRPRTRCSARGVKALHLAYLGDAEIGAEANIGAGVITCNYDGEKKHRTVIGEKAFIGSDSQLVAPVTRRRRRLRRAPARRSPRTCPDGALALEPRAAGQQGRLGRAPQGQEVGVKYPLP